MYKALKQGGINMILQKEQEFFDTHKEQLRKDYLGKRVIISGSEIKGAFDSDEEALSTALKTMKPGTFMIKFITENDEDQIQRFYSRVYV